MKHCASCNLEFDEDSKQRYYTTDIGAEIVSIIEQRIGHEIDVDGVLCDTCMHSALQDLQNNQTSHTDQLLLEVKPEPRLHDSHVCVWCGSTLFKRRTHSLPEGPERSEILMRIFPREIPDGALVCYACWVHVTRITRILQSRESAESTTSGDYTQSASATRSGDNINVCVWCRAALSRRRSHALPEGLERNEVASRIYPREIPNHGRVCYACWVRAQRNVRRQTAMEERANINPEASNHNLKIRYCVWCRSSLIRRRTHAVKAGPERNEIAAKIYPREIPDDALACDECWTRAQLNINVDVDSVDQEPIPVRIHLDEFRHTPETSSRCFVPGCLRTERLCVPEFLRKRILTAKKLFVTKNARVCAEHRTFYNWDILDGHQFSNSFTKELIEAMLQLSTVEIHDMQLNFENIDSISDPVFKYWTGVSKLQYLSIIQEIPMLSETCKHPKTALGLYLIKSHTGDSHDRIASLFQMSKASVSRLIGKARDALNQRHSNI